MGILRNNNKILKQNHKFPSIGNGLKFDGVNDMVTTPYNSAFQIGSEFSLTIFFVPRSSAFQVLVNKLSSPSSGWSLYFTGNQIRFYRGDYYTDINYSFSLNTLYCITISLNSIDENYYVNGGVIYTKARTSTIEGSASALKIGQDSVSSLRFLGTIYDVKIFNKALVQEEVNLLYNSNNNLIPITAYPNLVVNYTFNQKQGTGLDDSSGNNHTGTLLNYAGADTSLGATNSWVDENGNPILV